MKYFVINDAIAEPVFNDFVSFYNANSEEDCTITINTGGGKSYVMWAMIHMINEMPKVRLLIQGVYSAGFMIAYLTKCTKIISTSTKGMHHQSTAQISMNHDGKVSLWEDRCIIKNMTLDKKEGERVAKKIMTKKEYKKYKADQDIYFGFKRMKQIFPDAIVIK